MTLPEATRRLFPNYAPEDLSIERAQTMKAFGAELILTPKSGGMEYARDLADKMEREGKGRVLDQFANQDNPNAHYMHTGPEIWRDTNGEVTHFVSSMGTTGTIMGVSRYLKEQNPDIRIIGVEPASRQHSLSGIKRITGLPDEHYPKILDPNLLDDLVSVTDEEAFNAAIEVARRDGIMVGPTTGAVLHAALHGDTPRSGRAVLISADNAAKYVGAYASFLARQD